MAAKRALIVDDSRSARAFLARLVERQGLEVDGVGSAAEAYAYLRRQLPDVLFLDHLMPGADGFEVLKVLKKDGRTRAIPVLMYTSQQGDDYLAQARSLGAVGVLPKQLRAADVIGALEQLGLRAEPAATQVPGHSTTVVDAHGRAPTQATTVVDPHAGAGGTARLQPVRPGPPPPAAGSPAPGLSPELRSLLEALVREQGLAVRQQVAQLVAQQGERMAGDLRAIRREITDLNERLAASAADASVERRALRSQSTLPTRALAWAAVVLVLGAALLGALWLLRPDWITGAAAPAAAGAPSTRSRDFAPPAGAASSAAPAAATPAPASPAQGASGGATAPGQAPLFAAPEPDPRERASPPDAPAADPAATGTH